MSESRTHYEVLGIPVGAGADQVAKRYKELLASAKSNLKSKPVDPDWLASAREAYVVLTDPQKRAAYDKLIAAEQEVSARASSSTRQRTHFLARAWRGEIRAWKLFWLMLLPAWLVSEGLSTWVGGMFVGLSTLWVPLPVLVALGFIVVLAVVFGAVLLWRCAFNVSWKVLGYAGRLFAAVALASFAAGLQGHVTGKSQLAKYARIATGESTSGAPVAKERTLLVAAQQGDLAQVKKLLDKGESPNVRETERHNLGRTPLHYAAGGKYYSARGQHLEVAGLLLARGADVNAKGNTGYTPLHVASGLGQVEMVEFLLKNGADINAKDTRGTPLHAAVLQGHEPVVALLIQNKASLNGVAPVLSLASSYTPAHTAIVRRLLDAGVDPNEASDRGITLFDAVADRSEDAAYLLVERGTNLEAHAPDQFPRAFTLAQRGYVKTFNLASTKGLDHTLKGPRGQSLLHFARSPELVDVLLAKGLKVDLADHEGNQPLHYAVRERSLAVAERLIARGAPINAANNEGTTPVMLARHSNKEGEGTKLLDLLLDKGANVQARDKRGFAALDIAVANIDLETVKRLLEKGASASARDANGYTALYRARHDGVANLLIAAGAKARDVASDGKTPLHFVAAKGEWTVVDVLLKHGANANAVDKSGQTPLFAAAGYPNIATALLDAGASVKISDVDGKTPLHYAAVSSSDLAKVLVDKGADLNARDKLGNTPLHDAAARNLSFAVERLIRLGADPTVRNLEGKTAEQLAAEVVRARLQQTFSPSPSKDGQRAESPRTPKDKGSRP